MTKASRILLAATLGAPLMASAGPESWNLPWSSQPKIPPMQQGPMRYCSDPIRDGMSGERERICHLVNLERARYGIGPINLHPNLDSFAQNYAYQMATRNFYSHVDPEGNGLVRRLRRFGIPWARAGENIAVGQRSCETVMTAWMNSAGHRRSILNPGFRWLGVGKAGPYWSQVFTN